MQVQKVFEALSSPVRRRILAYISARPLPAGEIAARFDISKPSISQHLSVLENAGLVKAEKKGQFIYYALVEDSLINTLSGFAMEVCPAGGPLRRESRKEAKGAEPSVE